MGILKDVVMPMVLENQKHSNTLSRIASEQEATVQTSHDTLRDRVIEGVVKGVSGGLASGLGKALFSSGDKDKSDKNDKTGKGGDASQDKPSKQWEGKPRPGQTYAPVIPEGKQKPESSKPLSNELEREVRTQQWLNTIDVRNTLDKQPSNNLFMTTLPGTMSLPTLTPLILTI